MTLLWLLTGSVLANIAIWSGQKLAPSVGFTLVTAGLALGWVMPHGHYAVLANGTKCHDSECYAVREAIMQGERITWVDDDDVRNRGLERHQCLNRIETYTVSTPHKYPAAKIQNATMQILSAAEGRNLSP